MTQGTRGTAPETRAAEPARVLICDDETRLARLTAELIEDSGFQSMTIPDGERALSLLMRPDEHFDVLLLDVNLPEGPTAGEVLASMLKNQLSTRVVLTSGLAVEDIPRSLVQHRLVTSYLSKPYSVDDLVDAIRSAIAA